jgi:2-methylcitrate dehydratase PrpD
MMTEPHERSDAGMRSTLDLAETVIAVARSGVPGDVEASVIEGLAWAFGRVASHSADTAVDAVLALAHTVGGPGRVPVPGRDERLDPLNAATAIGSLIALVARDDPLPARVGSATVAAAFALGSERGATGATFVRAVALGSEIEVRVSQLMDRSLRAGGWDRSGTTGVLGAAVAAGIICGLSGDRLASALGIAASSTVGLREAEGTALESLHAGKAASNGLLAAVLAEADFDGSLRVLEAPRGYLSVLGGLRDADSVSEGLGVDWRIGSAPPIRSVSDPHPVADAVRALPSAEDLGALGSVLAHARVPS